LTISVVLADANILFSRTLRDYVLYAADEGAIEVHWSRQIMAVSRNLRENLGFSHDSTSRLEQLMNDYIEYALVEVDPGHLAAVEAVEMDTKDRHVLAAALSADADILLTENTKDFPAQWMAEQGMELLTTGQLLIRLADRFPDKMRAAHEKTVRYSPKPEADILSTLERTAGKYAADAIREVAPDSMPPGNAIQQGQLTPSAYFEDGSRQPAKSSTP
jgi:predicted nucleic acid-binding protein